jgi:hypothetical protein
MIQFLGRIAPRERKRMSSQLLDGSDGRCIGSGVSGSVFANARTGRSARATRNSPIIAMRIFVAARRFQLTVNVHA